MSTKSRGKDEYIEIKQDSVTVTFTLPELWLLHDVVRHDMPEADRWSFPPVSYELNKEIGRAIAACAQYKLAEYTLDLTEHQLLVIDYGIRRDFKTPEGAKGADILLKVFNAREQLAWAGWDGTEYDETFQQAITRTRQERSTSDASSTD